MEIRATLKKLHLYIAAFLVPFIFLMSLSGGLEILGVKGNTDKELIHTASKNSLNFNSPTIQQDVENLLEIIGVDTDIDHLKIANNTIYTRPTYTTYYALKRKGGKLNVYKYTPDFIKKLMVLHKGNGPAFYQFFQKLLVIGLLIVLSIGLWLGLATKKTRNKTILTFIAGAGLYLIALL